MTRSEALELLRSDMELARSMTDPKIEKQYLVHGRALLTLGRMHKALALYFGPESELDAERNRVCLRHPRHLREENRAMTKEEFIQFLKDQVKRFEVYWEKRQQEKPEWYPSEMSLSDWLEQFELFE
jgi:hypothetical protein